MRLFAVVFSFLFLFSFVSAQPQILGPYGVSSCLDNDPIPFTVQSLGANFVSPVSSNGANVVLNPPIPGLPQNLFVPDFCLGPYPQSIASDVVCGSNIGISGVQNNAYFVVKDCRFVMNSLSAGCSLGRCV